MEHKALLKQIAKDLFIGNPVKFAMKREGQFLNERNMITLGGRAGPDVNVEYLMHEICHLAEREIDVIQSKPESSWGFSFGKYWEICGHSGFETQTAQSVYREARVWSYQLSLSRHYQFDISAEELVSSAVYLPALCHFQYHYPETNYDRKEDEALLYLGKLVEEQAEEFSYDRFMVEWEKRMSIL